MALTNRCASGHGLLEPLEARKLMSASPALDVPQSEGGSGPAVTTLYTETNSPETGRNAVLAFRRDPNSGQLRQIGKFFTGGTGQFNPQQAIGPDDSDQEVIASPDGRFLFAVNQGSNSVATFRIERNGGLDLIGTFGSGGTQPVSLGLSGNHLYVTNRGDVSTANAGTVAPNYSVLQVNEDGSLTAIPQATVTLPVGLSPSQTLISRDGKFVFGDNFAVPGTSPKFANTIDPFQINPDGSLTVAPGGAVGATGTASPLLLGLTTHPTQQIIYAGLTGSSQIGVFTYDATGALTFVGAVAEKGAGPCWVTVSADGKYLYAANTGSDSVGVFSLADPLHPVEVQDFALGGPFAPPGSPAGTRETATFELALDPTGHSLYVIDQTTAANHDFQQGNALHVLSVAADGTVSEPAGPVLFSPADVSANARPQGLALVAGRSQRDDNVSDPSHGGNDRALASLGVASNAGASTLPFSSTPVSNGAGAVNVDDLLDHSRS